MSTSIAPGEALPASAAGGAGTFLWGGVPRASIAGLVQDHSVLRKSVQAPMVLPTVGDRCTCRVTRISSKMVSVDLVCVGDTPLRESCAGLIRKEDMQSSSLPATEVHRCFRPGDIILAKVLSLGDSRAYYLTSSDPELGVVLARSADGAVMKPVSYQELECPITGARERRKVARPPNVNV